MRRPRRYLVVSTLVLGLTATPGLAQDRMVNTEHYDLKVETIASHLEHPWGLALMPDGRFLVTERDSGRLRIGSADGELSGPVAGTPEIYRYEETQAGLFDVVLHPDFEQNHLVYLSFSKPSPKYGAGTAIIRGRLVEENGAARLEDMQTIFEMNDGDKDPGGLHFGGTMAFSPKDNTLFLTIGDRRNMSRAQKPDDQAGSIIRVADDGSVPRDNPFFDDPEKDDKIYSWGHRNSQGLALNRETNQLWSNEHGPRGGDEINLVQAGSNYGWPLTTGGVDYSGAPVGFGPEREGLASAIHIFKDTVALSGLVVYAGDLFAKWRGDLLNGGLASEALIRVRVADGKVVDEEWIKLNRRVRDIEVAKDGSIWLITDHADGEVLRLTTAGG